MVSPQCRVLSRASPVSYMLSHFLFVYPKALAARVASPGQVHRTAKPKRLATSTTADHVEA
jgi:hypothetical protein